MNTAIIQLPFAGFYCSRWDDALDRSLETTVQYMLDSGELPDGVELDEAMSAACTSAKWDHGLVARRYAEEFLHKLAGTLGLPSEGAGFTEMDSPRCYNFATDRVFASIPTAWVEGMHNAVDMEVLDRVAAERHTSRSGFVSFYSPDWLTWGGTSKWDHNQLLTLLLAYLETVGEDADEMEESILDHLEGNGIFDEAVGLDFGALCAELEEHTDA